MRRIGGVSDQHPSHLVTRSMNLHTQSHLSFEDSLTCTLTSKNIYSLGYCSPVTNNCSRKPFNDLSVSVEPLSLPVPSGYIA